MRMLKVAAVAMIPLLGWSCSTMSQAPSPEFNEARKNTSIVFRRQWCRLAKASGLPIHLDPALRAELYKSLGEEKGRELLYPVARTNNSYGCFCTSGEDRKRYVCGGQ